MMQLLFLFSMIFQTSASSVRILVADAQGQPMSKIRVSLVLYEFVSAAGKMEARETFSKHCTTDANGECTIQIGETSGILRGRIDLGKYGGRDVFWPGGALTAPVLVDIEAGRVKGTEAGAYDFQEQDGGIMIQKSVPWLVIGIGLLAVGSIVVLIYLKARKEHA